MNHIIFQVPYKGCAQGLGCLSSGEQVVACWDAPDLHKIEGNTLTVTTNQGDTVTVQIADDTPVLKEVAGSKSDLAVGTRVLVVGERSGTNVAARSIQITDGAGGLGDLRGGSRATPTPGQ